MGQSDCTSFLPFFPYGIRLLYIMRLNMASMGTELGPFPIAHGYIGIQQQCSHSIEDIQQETPVYQAQVPTLVGLFLLVFFPSRKSFSKLCSSHIYWTTIPGPRIQDFFLYESPSVTRPQTTLPLLFREKRTTSKQTMRPLRGFFF